MFRKWSILLRDNGNTNDSVMFVNNHTNNGGAIFVVDDTNSAACSSSVECLFFPEFGN